MRTTKPSELTQKKKEKKEKEEREKAAIIFNSKMLIT